MKQPAPNLSPFESFIDHGQSSYCVYNIKLIKIDLIFIEFDLKNDHEKLNNSIDQFIAT